MSKTTKNELKAEAHKPLDVASLRWTPQEENLPFDTTDELDALEGIIGQRRALNAIKIGAEIDSPGYNMFVNGLSGTGRLTTIKNILEDLPDDDAELYDIAYVNNFDDPDRPRVLRLPKGQVRTLRSDLRDAISFLRVRIPAMFEDEGFRKGRSRILDQYREREKALVEEFEAEVKPKGFILGQREVGPNMSQPELLPLIDGTPYAPDDIEQLIRDEKLTVDEARNINEQIDNLQEDLYDLVRKGRKIASELRSKLVDYERSQATMLVSSALDEIRGGYPMPSVHEFVRNVRQHILENLDLFGPQRQPQSTEDSFADDQIHIGDPFHLYDIKIVLDNAETAGRPVIIERNPSFVNLFGTIERVRLPDEGWASDFSSIKSGSILQADGGFLIINAIDALTEPGVWTMMKRVLLHRKLQIHSPEMLMQLGSMPSVSGIKPEDIRLNVKVIMIGPPVLYQALFHSEEDFQKIFKINASFDYEIERTDQLLLEYARFVRRLSREEELLPFDRSGVASILEFAAEKAGRQDRLSLRFSDIADILREASYWASSKGNSIVCRRHVEYAVGMVIDRNSMWKEKIMERIDDGTLLIDTDGERVGQINGLAVYDLGQVSFGKPTRITATVAVGRTGIVNIDREAQLSGSLYNKGALILSGFFRQRFAQDRSLSLSASIVFEQSYGEVEGDSASSTEIYALLSALSNVPIRQNLAVTGSVNQWGEIQPIGGVKEKIEGFFDVCCQRGLHGEHGVLIPVQNVSDLMLRSDVIEAVAEDKFRVYPVITIDQGIEILTGVKAGRLQADGTWESGSINALVQQRLEDLSEKLRQDVPQAPPHQPIRMNEQ